MVPSVLGAIALLALTGPGGAVPDPSPSLDGIEVTYEEDQKITWYRPRLDPWETFDFRIYPAIGSADGGLRKLVLHILVKNPRKGRPTALRVMVGDDPWLVPISESERIVTHDSGCRVTQSIFLQNQASVVQMLAGAPRAEVALIGYGRPARYQLTAGDLENFRRIAALWSAPALPPAPPKPAPSSPLVPGVGDVTLPEIIPSSKVTPRFPRLAEGKNVLGRVVLQAVVRKDGSVGSIEVLRPAGGDCGFEESAIDAVRRWRYKPATRDGQPVDVYFTIVVDFTYGHFRMAPG